MLRQFVGDLHIHTCLSPCGDKDMVPTRIIKEAINKGLNIIGITDHNSTENVLAVKNKGAKYGIEVFGGIEITSKEEVHILAFFDNESQLVKIQEIIYENLSDEENDEELFGEQLIIDDNDGIIGKNKRLLIGATELKIEKIVDVIHNLDGLAIASHIDREAFSIIGQLGFIPDGLKLDAVEVSPKFKLSTFNFQLSTLPVASFSDAHRLTDIGSAKTIFILQEPTVKELKKALLNQDGRGVII